MALADELRKDPPRSAALGERVVAKHSAWWGFAVYGVLYAITVMALGMSFVYYALEPKLHVHWIILLVVSTLVTAPVTSLPFVRWVRRRREGVARLAREGRLAIAEITQTSWANATNIAALLSGDRPTATTTIRVRPTEGKASYAVTLPRRPSWASKGSAVDVVVLDRVPYVLVIAPTGEDFLAKRV